HADLAVLWMLVFSIGPGLFFPLEQELSRLMAHRRAQGVGTGALQRRIAGIAAAMTLALVGLLALARDPLAQLLFDGRSHMVDVLGVNVAALGVAHVSRGLLSGHTEFSRYGAQLALEGTLRCASAAALLVNGVASAAGYGLVLAAATLLAVAFTVNRRTLRLPSGPPVAYAEIAGGMGLLVVSNLLWLALVNASVVSARLLASPSEAAIVGALLSAVLIARVPLFLFASVQASLLPALSAAAAAGDRAGFQQRLTRTVGAVAGLGVAGAALSAIFGPALSRLLFDGGTALSHADFAWLAVATAVYMVATVIGQAGLALSGHREQAVGWAAGFAALLAVTCVPAGILLRVELAFLAGAATAAVVLATQLARRMRLWWPAGMPALAAPISSARPHHSSVRDRDL
ncbi:MAG: polysaccharide biosynthesis protein, partial [Micromonosporaceae bacterium]